MSNLTSQLIAKITQLTTKQMRGRISHFLVLLLFLLLSLLLLNFLDLHLNHIQRIQYPISIRPVLIDIIGTEHPPRSFDIVFNEIQNSKNKPDTKQKSNQTCRHQYNHISRIVKSRQLDQDITHNHITRYVLQNKYIFTSLPLSLYPITCIIVQSLRTPRQVINPGKCKHLQQVDISRRIKDITQDRGDHLHIFLKTKCPKNRQSMPHNNENNHNSQPNKRNNEILRPGTTSHLRNNKDRIDNQQHNNYKSINSQQSRRQVI